MMCGARLSAQASRRDESPVERLLRRGPASLSDAELVSLLLPGSNSLATALEVLGERGLGLLGSAPDVGRLLSLRGVGLATVAVLCATAELAHRLIRFRCPAPQRLRPSHQAAEYLYQRYEGSDREVVGAVYLNSRQQLVGVEEWRRLAVERILASALLRDAACFVLFYARLSRDPAPTLEELRFSHRARQAGVVVGIEMLDHLILGPSGRWVSIQGGWRP